MGVQASKSTKETAKVFRCFPKLPPEIRDMVWKEFMLGESENRIVFIHRSRPHLQPDTSLISPLLSVSQESRATALKYYSTKLTVYVVTHKSFCRLSFLPKGLLYVNVEQDRFRRVIHGGTRVLNLRSQYLHFHDAGFARDSPGGRLVGFLTEELPDKHLPINEQPNYEEMEFSDDEIDSHYNISDFDLNFSDSDESSDSGARHTLEEPSGAEGEFDPQDESGSDDSSYSECASDSEDGSGYDNGFDLYETIFEPGSVYA